MELYFLGYFFGLSLALFDKIFDFVVGDFEHSFDDVRCTGYYVFNIILTDLIV